MCVCACVCTRAPAHPATRRPVGLPLQFRNAGARAAIESAASPSSRQDSLSGEVPAHGVLVTAVSPKAFEQAQGMVRRGGTISLNGLPPGDFPLPIFETVLNGITVRGSIVGTRQDLQESLDFAGEGKVKATVSSDRLENINAVFQRMIDGQIEGRVVLDMAS